MRSLEGMDIFSEISHLFQLCSASCRSVKPIISFSLLISPLIMILAYFSPSITHGQFNTSATQTWVDKYQNTKMMFGTIPMQPLTGKITDLSFSIQNLQTGKPMINLLASVVVLTNSSGQERSVRFTNILVHDGYFSIKYPFPGTGSYQIISKITSRSHDFATLASFRVIIPPQPSALNFLGANYIFWISFLVTVVAGVASFLIVKYIMYKD